jgi:cell shape-determining protein MreD
MTAAFSAAVCLFLVVFETTVMADLPILEGFFDLLVTFVVYLGLYRPVKESIPVIVCLGFVMDSLSAAPFGLYLTGYVWIFVGIKWLMRYLQVRTSALVLFVVPLAVAIQTILSLAAIGLQPHGSIETQPVMNQVGGHLLWALLTGPLFLMFYEAFHDRLEKWAAARKVERNGF